MKILFSNGALPGAGRFVWAALVCLVLAGCASTRPGVTPPERGPLNVRAVERWPEGLTRVAVLPAHDATGRLTPEFTASQDAAWGRALAETHRAEWVRMDGAQLAAWSGRATLSPVETLPADTLERIAARTGAGAVLFFELTQVSPYPPLVLAFRARLVSTDDGATLWAVDEIFDARDPVTAKAARASAQIRAQGPGDAGHAVLQSPTRFADHAYGVVLSSLPPRLEPVAAADAAKAAGSGTNGREIRAKQYPVRADHVR